MGQGRLGAEPGRQRPPRGRLERGDNPVDPGLVERRRHRLPSSNGIALAPMTGHPPASRVSAESVRCQAAEICFSVNVLFHESNGARTRFGRLFRLGVN